LRFEDRYELQVPLGETDRGSVWSAKDVEKDRSVAIAILGDQADDAAREHFQEINLAARISRSETLVRIHETGETSEGALFTAMELLSGESLRSRLAQGPALPLVDTVKALVRVLRGLQKLHNQEIAHGDVCPSNIIITAEDGVVPKLVGLGTGRDRIRAGKEPLDDDGQLLSLAYMSPTQARGEVVRDPASDVFSLAGVLYSVLTGHPPHHGLTVEALRADVANSPVWATQRARPELRGPLSDVVSKALSQRGYDTATAFAKAIERALAKSKRLDSLSTTVGPLSLEPGFPPEATTSKPEPIPKAKAPFPRPKAAAIPRPRGAVPRPLPPRKSPARKKGGVFSDSANEAETKKMAAVKAAKAEKAKAEKAKAEKAKAEKAKAEKAKAEKAKAEKAKAEKARAEKAEAEKAREAEAEAARAAEAAREAEAEAARAAEAAREAEAEAARAAEAEVERAEAAKAEAESVRPAAPPPWETSEPEAPPRESHRPSLPEIAAIAEPVAWDDAVGRGVGEEEEGDGPSAASPAAAPPTASEPIPEIEADVAGPPSLPPGAFVATPKAVPIPDPLGSEVHGELTPDAFATAALTPTGIEPEEPTTAFPKWVIAIPVVLLLLVGFVALIAFSGDEPEPGPVATLPSLPPDDEPAPDRGTEHTPPDRIEEGSPVAGDGTAEPAPRADGTRPAAAHEDPPSSLEGTTESGDEAPLDDGPVTMTRVRLTGVPADATVYYDRARISGTELDVADDDTGHVVEVRLAGHRTFRHRFRGTPPAELAVRLPARAASTPRPAGTGRSRRSARRGRSRPGFVNDPGF